MLQWEMRPVVFESENQKKLTKKKISLEGKKEIRNKKIEEIPDSPPPPQQLLTRVLAEEEEYRCISCVYREIISKEALVELLYYMNETGLSIKDRIYYHEKINEGLKDSVKVDFISLIHSREIEKIDVLIKKTKE